MSLRSVFQADPSFLDNWAWDVAFTGPSIDDRGKESIRYLTDKVEQVVSVRYDPDNITVDLASHVYDKDAVAPILVPLKDQKIILDTTTLGVAELLILLQTFKDIGVTQVSLLYLEPTEYNRKFNLSDTSGLDKEILLHRRDFELSETVRGYIGIPGHALSISSLTNPKVAFLCGFESDRVDQALEDLEIISRNCYCLFGVPAFTPGWEMNSFASHISVLNNRNLRAIQFCGSTNPMAVYHKLDQIYQECGPETPLFVAPLATKPMSIGACLFLISKPKDRVAILFDHPTKKEGRAKQVANWNLYEVNLQKII